MLSQCCTHSRRTLRLSRLIPLLGRLYVGGGKGNGYHPRMIVRDQIKSLSTQCVLWYDSGEYVMTAYWHGSSVRCMREYNNQMGAK